jgi:hypothetical protein
MTTTLEPSINTQLDDFEYEATLARLRDYRHQLDEADRKADTGSLDRAGDMTRVLLDRRWATDGTLPPPKKSHFKPVDPYSRSRFATWIKAKLDYQPRHCYQLLNAEQVASNLRRAQLTPGEGERALRTLSPLLRKGREHEIPAIWERAVKLARGGIPNTAQVRQALVDHNKATGFTAPPRQKVRKAETYRKKHRTDWENFLEYGSREDAKAELQWMVKQFKARAGTS